MGPGLCEGRIPGLSDSRQPLLVSDASRGGGWGDSAMPRPSTWDFCHHMAPALERMLPHPRTRGDQAEGQPSASKQTAAVDHFHSTAPGEVG